MRRKFKYGVGLGVVVVGAGLAILAGKNNSDPEPLGIVDDQPVADATNVADQPADLSELIRSTDEVLDPTQAGPAEVIETADPSLAAGEPAEPEADAIIVSLHSSPEAGALPAPGEFYARPQPSDSTNDNTPASLAGSGIATLLGTTDADATLVDTPATGAETPDSALLFVRNNLEQLATNTAPTTQPATPETHTIAAGDTFSGLAVKYFGNAKYTGRILAANPQIDPRRLFVGAVVKIPARPESAQPVAQPAAGRGTTVASGQTYVVQPGETWSDLGNKFYGNAIKYVMLYEYNKEHVPANHNLLPAGTVLQLPKDVKLVAKVVAPTTQPSRN